MRKRCAATERERIESDMERMTKEERKNYLRHLTACIFFLLLVGAGLMIAGAGIIWNVFSEQFPSSVDLHVILNCVLALLMIPGGCRLLLQGIRSYRAVKFLRTPNQTEEREKS